MIESLTRLGRSGFISLSGISHSSSRCKTFFCCLYEAVIKPFFGCDVHPPNGSSGTMFSTTQVLPKPLTYSERQCTRWFIFQETGMQLVISAVEVMLIIRGEFSTTQFPGCSPAYSRKSLLTGFRIASIKVRALYLKNERITKILVILFFVEVITMIVILVFLAGSVKMDEHCVVVSTPPLFMVFACVFLCAMSAGRAAD